MPPKTPTVDAFLADLDHERAVDIRRFRAALLAGDPELGERIKWNAPSFGHDGDDRVTFRLRPGHRFELVLHRGVARRDDPFAFDDADGQVTWAAMDRGTVAVPNPLNEPALERLLALAHRWLVATRG